MVHTTNISEARKRHRIQKYFGEFPTWASWLLGIGLAVAVGACVALVALPGEVSRVEVGPYLVLCIVAGLAASRTGLAVLRDVPSDDQIDAWLAEDLKRLRDHALIALSLTEDELVGDRQVEVWGPYRPYSPHHLSIDLESVYEVCVSAEQEFKKGKDGRVRYSVVHLSIIFLTQHHLSAYSCVWNFVKGEVVWEKSDEFFYQDIVSVSTETVRMKSQLSEQEKAKRKKEGKPDGELVEERERFRLTTSAGTGIKVSLPERKLVQQLGEFVTSNVESNIRSIRKMLRAKKTSGTDPTQ